MLGSSDRSLCDAYDLAMLDLDGVVYVGGDAVPGAPDHLAAAREAGMRLAFITNNAARPPAQVAEHLRELGVAAEESDVVTSAQAAARLLLDRLGARRPTSRCSGATGSRRRWSPRASSRSRCTTTRRRSSAATGPTWSGATSCRPPSASGTGCCGWPATPTARSRRRTGWRPGHGVLVETLSSFSGVDPVVAGKPERPLLDETVRRVGGDRPLMVGDRLDTDIAGARNAGLDSLLVMTGVTGLAELVAATPGERPTYVAADLAGLLEAHAAPEADGDDPALGGWRAGVDSGRLVVSGEGDASDWWRVVATAAWQHLDDSGDVVDVEGVRAPLA